MNRFVKTLSLVLVSLLIAALPAGAASWIGGTDIWDDTNTTPWQGGVIPVAAAAVNLTQVTAGNMDITYGVVTPPTAGPSNPEGTYYGNLVLSNSGGGVTSLNLDLGDSLPPTNTNIYAGGRLALNDGTFYTQSEMYLRGGEVAQSGGLVTLRNYDLNLYPGAGVTATYNLSGGTVQIPGGRALEIGSHNHAAAPAGTSVFNLSGAAQILGKVNVGKGGASTSTLTQTGGSINTTGSRPEFTVRASGIYNLQDGTNYMANFLMPGGNFTQSGGTVTASYELQVATVVGGTATAAMSGGTAAYRGIILGGSYSGVGAPPLGGAGTLTHSGGTITVSDGGNAAAPGIFVGHADSAAASTFTLKGGTLAGGASLRVQAPGTLQGYGSVPLGTFRQITNSGRIIADGDGVERSLDLSSYTGFNNSTGPNEIQSPAENASDHGWYATDKGKLILPALGRAGSGFYYINSVTGNSYNWGEQANDTAIDLVNSARFTFSGLGAGNGVLTGSLLATDRSDVPVFDLGMGFQGLISVHDFGLTGNTFSSFDLTIRYDEAAAGEFESDLQVFHYTGGAWLPVTTGLDLANNLITAGGLTSFSLFGVGYAIPEPGTLALAAVAGLALLRRHR